MREGEPRGGGGATIGLYGVKRVAFSGTDNFWRARDSLSGEDHPPPRYSGIFESAAASRASKIK